LAHFWYYQSWQAVFHLKKDAGELKINIYRAQPEGNLRLEFAKEDPTVVDYSFIAMPKRGANFFGTNYLEIIETFLQQQP